MTARFPTAAALAAAVPATAHAERTASATATRGALEVSSAVQLGPGTATHLGGWTGRESPCTRTRRLAVAARIDYANGARSFSLRRRSDEPVENCAAAGPTSGPQPFVARRLDLACPDGSWRPGRYTFTTVAEHVLTGLRATATLVWQRTRRC